jgi:hypothetical protein
MTLRLRLLRLAYPKFDCENCVGYAEMGCYCDYHGAVAPGIGPSRRHMFWRWVWRKTFGRKS